MANEQPSDAERAQVDELDDRDLTGVAAGSSERFDPADPFRGFPTFEPGQPPSH